MKYVVLLCDGMADYPYEKLNGSTPMELAKKPNMDALAKVSRLGLAKTVDDSLSPGSDVANLSVMGYDPLLCYTGRSPLEAASIGIDMGEDDVAFRCNLVTLSDEAEYENCVMVDYCADDISTAEADELIKAVDEALGDELHRFYTGVSYRHCLILKGMKDKLSSLNCFTPPHDISDRVITEYLPTTDEGKALLELMKKSREILKNHPVNLKRIQNGKRPANSIWLWGCGSKPSLEAFEDLYGKKGAVVSAVDLIKGIGLLAKMKVCEVEGATGYIDTNFENKANAAIDALKNGCDLVYIHVEAPDECGHRGEAENKIRAIELIDERVLGPVKAALTEMGDHAIMILPDHPTPLALKTHVRDAVPYLIYRSNEVFSGADTFTEKTAGEGVYIDRGCKLMNIFLGDK